MGLARQGFGSLGPERGRHYAWELRSPFPFGKMREAGAAQTFLEVPSRAFPDSRQGLYSKPGQIPLSSQVGLGEHANLLEQGGCWSHSPLPFGFSVSPLPYCNMQGARTAN